MDGQECLVLRQTPFGPRCCLSIIGLDTVVTASIFKIDEVVTVNGIILPKDSEVKILYQARFKVYVSDGDLVKKAVLSTFEERSH